MCVCVCVCVYTSLYNGTMNKWKKTHGSGIGLYFSMI